MIKRLSFKLFPLLFLIVSITVHAQSTTGVNISQGGYGMVKTNISTSYDHRWRSIEDGFAARISYELFRQKYVTITANARYASSETRFNSSELSEPYNPDAINFNGTHIMGQVGFTSTFRSRLFGKPFMGMAMFNSEWGENGFARVSGIAMGLIMLRANRNTQFGIGPLVMVNSCSKIPAFLVFMYRHRFNDKWLINLYGGMFGVEYTPSPNNLFCIGADIDVKAFYFKPKHNDLPSHCRFTSTSFRPMIKYRRKLAQNLFFDLQGGGALKMSCRVNGVTGSKEYFDCHQKPTAFIQTGVSYSL